MKLIYNFLILGVFFVLSGCVATTAPVRNFDTDLDNLSRDQGIIVGSVYFEAPPVVEKRSKVSDWVFHKVPSDKHEYYLMFGGDKIVDNHRKILAQPNKEYFFIKKIDSGVHELKLRASNLRTKKYLDAASNLVSKSSIGSLCAGAGRVYYVGRINIKLPPILSAKSKISAHFVNDWERSRDFFVKNHPEIAKLIEISDFNFNCSFIKQEK